MATVEEAPWKLAAREIKESQDVLSSIGTLKPLFEEEWVTPRKHGMIEMSCLCKKRGTLATITINNPREEYQDLVLWSLEGPRQKEMINKLHIKTKESPGTVAAMMSYEPLDALLVVQQPALLHVLHNRDLTSLVQAPIPLHPRSLACMSQSMEKKEVIISFIDGKIAVYKLIKNTVIKKDKGDEASCVTREFNEYIVRQRISWKLGGGLEYVRDFCIDEGWHNEGVCALGIVDVNVICWKWESGQQMFKISGGHLQLRQRVMCIAVRDDVPQIIAGFKDGRVVNWSIRPGSRGKAVESLGGHNDEVHDVKIDHGAGIIYTIDARAVVKCWHMDSGVLMNSVDLGDDDVNDDDIIKDNPWAFHEIKLQQCNVELAYIDGTLRLSCYTPKHNVKVLEGMSHRRYFAQAPCPFVWVSALSSPKLSKALRHHIFGGHPPSRPKLSLPERGAGDDEIILGVCSDGSLYIYEARSGEVLSLVVLSRRHELFVSGEAHKGGGKLTEGGEEDGDGGKDPRKKKKKKRKAKVKEVETKIDIHFQKKAAAERARASQQLVDEYRLRSNQLSGKQAAEMLARNEAARKEVEEKLGRISRLKPDKELAAAVRDLGVVRTLELNSRIGMPFGCEEGLLVLLWESGSIDLMRLDTQQCVQSYREVVRDFGQCFCFAFFPDADDDTGVGGHTMITGHGTGHIKIWSKTNVFPSAQVMTLRVGEDEQGDVMAIVPSGGVISVGHRVGNPTHMITCTQRGPIGIYEANTWLLVARVTIRTYIRISEGLSSAMMYTPSILILCYTDGVIRLWRFGPLHDKKKTMSVKKQWNTAKNKSLGALALRNTLKVLADADEPLRAESSQPDCKEVDPFEPDPESDDNEGETKHPGKLLRSRSVKLLDSAPKSLEGFTPLWPLGTKEEGDVEAMFAIQYGNMKLIAALPEYRKFITRSDTANMTEWGLREDKLGRITLTMADHLSRDAELVIRKAGRGDIVHAQHAAYLHAGSALIAFAIGCEINFICGGFKHAGSRYAGEGLKDAVNARKGYATTGRERHEASQGEEKLSSPDKGGGNDFEGSRKKKGMIGQREIIPKKSRKKKDVEEKSTVGFSRTSSGETTDEEMSGKDGLSRRRRAAIMADRILTDLPTPRPDYFEAPQPIYSEAEINLLNLKKVLGPRMDSIGGLVNTDVIPTPFTLRFSATEGVTSDDIPIMPSSMYERALVQAGSSNARVYMRRPAPLEEPELSPRTKMRSRLRHAAKTNRDVADRTGPHLAKHMWQGLDRTNAQADSTYQGAVDMDMSMSEIGSLTSFSQNGVMASTWGGLACHDDADKTIKLAHVVNSVNPFFNMNSKNLISVGQQRPAKAKVCRNNTASPSLSVSLSTLSLASSSTSSFVPLSGHHPDPRPGYAPGSTALLGSWNRHVIRQDLLLSGKQEHIQVKTSPCATRERARNLGFRYDSVKRASPMTSPSRPSSPTSSCSRRSERRRSPLYDWRDNDANLTRLSFSDYEKEASAMASAAKQKESEMQILATSSFNQQLDHDLPAAFDDLAGPNGRTPSRDARSWTAKRSILYAASAVATIRGSSAHLSNKGLYAAGAKETKGLKGRSSSVAHAGSNSVSRVPSATSVGSTKSVISGQQQHNEPVHMVSWRDMPNPPLEIDSRERALLNSLLSFQQEQIVALRRLLRRTRGQTPSPRKAPEMWAAEGAAVRVKAMVLREKMRVIYSMAPGLKMLGGKLYAAEAPS